MKLEYSNSGQSHDHSEAHAEPNARTWRISGFLWWRWCTRNICGAFGALPFEVALFGVGAEDLGAAAGADGLAGVVPLAAGAVAFDVWGGAFAALGVDAFVGVGGVVPLAAGPAGQ